MFLKPGVATHFCVAKILQNVFTYFFEQNMYNLFITCFNVVCLSLSPSDHHMLNCGVLKVFCVFKFYKFDCFFKVTKNNNLLLINISLFVCFYGIYSNWFHEKKQYGFFLAYVISLSLTCVAFKALCSKWTEIFNSKRHIRHKNINHFNIFWCTKCY